MTEPVFATLDGFASEVPLERFGRIRRLDLVAEARKMLGTPFVHRGRLAGVGSDCVGVAALPMLALGMIVPDVADYDRYSAGTALPTQLRKIAWPIPIDAAKPGDAIVFPHLSIRSRAERREEHFAWKVSFGRILQAWDASKGVVETEFDARWRRRAVAAYHLAEVEP